MKKPNGYDEAREAGEYTPVELGGHYAVVKQVTETQSRSGKDMIVVLFDFDKNDVQPDYFLKAFEDDTREEKKWPFNGSKYIMVLDYKDETKTSRNFKTFCSCIEKSNNMDIAWGGSNWSKQFNGKKIGVVFGEEEQEYNGELHMRRLPRYFCRTEKVADASIPDAIYINDKKQPEAQTAPAGFTIAEEEIPF